MEWVRKASSTDVIPLHYLAMALLGLVLAMPTSVGAIEHDSGGGAGSVEHQRQQDQEGDSKREEQDNESFEEMRATMGRVRLPIQVGQAWNDAKQALRKVGRECADPHADGNGAPGVDAFRCVVSLKVAGITVDHLVMETRDGHRVAKIHLATSQRVKQCKPVFAAVSRALGDRWSFTDPVKMTGFAAMRGTMAGDLNLSVLCGRMLNFELNLEDAWLQLPTDQTNPFGGPLIAGDVVFDSISRVVAAMRATGESNASRERQKSAVESDVLPRVKTCLDAAASSAPTLQKRSRAAFDEFQSAVLSDAWMEDQFVRFYEDQERGR